MDAWTEDYVKTESEQERYYRRKRENEVLNNYWSLFKFIILLIPLIIALVLAIGALLFIGTHIAFFGGALGSYLGFKIARYIYRREYFSVDKQPLINALCMLPFGAIFCWIGIWAKTNYFPDIDNSFSEYLVYIKDLISNW